jgi:hypothetical protein
MAPLLACLDSRSCARASRTSRLNSRYLAGYKTCASLCRRVCRRMSPISSPSSWSTAVLNPRVAWPLTDYSFKDETVALMT